MDIAQGQGTQWWRWSSFGLLLVAPVAAILTQGLAPTPHGHWSSHLGNAAISASQLAVLVAATLVLAAGKRLGGRLLTLLFVAVLAVVAVGLVMQVVGNQRIAASIWQTDYGDQAAGLVGPRYLGLSQDTLWPAPATCWCGWAAWRSRSCSACSGGYLRGWRWPA